MNLYSNIYLLMIFCTTTFSFVYVYHEYCAYRCEVDKFLQLKKQSFQSDVASCSKVKVFDEPAVMEREIQPEPKENKEQFVKVVKTSQVDKNKVDKNKGISLIWPVDKDKFWLSSYFGFRKLPNGRRQFHNGIDMAALRGTPVKSAHSGVIERAYEDPTGYGKTIIIKYNKIYKTRYAHLDRMLMHTGDTVTKGQLIGFVGATGNVRKTGKDASHLHFELYAYQKRIDPLIYLD